MPVMAMGYPPCTMSLWLRRRGSADPPQTVDRRRGVLPAVVHQVAQTQHAQSAEVRRGVAALEADGAPLLALAGAENLCEKRKGERPHPDAGSTTAPEAATRGPRSRGRTWV